MQASLSKQTKEWILSIVEENFPLEGFVPDYKLHSIPVLDRAIREARPTIREVQALIQFGVGIYIGEVIVRNIPGMQWGFDGIDETTLFELPVRLKLNKHWLLEIRPIRQVQGCWRSKSDGLQELIETVLGLVNGSVNPIRFMRSKWDTISPSKPIQATTLKDVV